MFSTMQRGMQVNCTVPVRAVGRAATSWIVARGSRAVVHRVRPILSASTARFCGNVVIQAGAFGARAAILAVVQSLTAGHATTGPAVANVIDGSEKGRFASPGTLRALLLQLVICAARVPWHSILRLPMARPRPALAAAGALLGTWGKVVGSFAVPLAALWTYGIAARIFAPAHWRSLQFWRRVLPIYVGYKTTQIAVAGRNDEERAKKWSKRHDWGAKKVYDLCVSLRGFYLKDGQYLGSRTDFIPLAWCEALRNLQDHVPPVPWSQVERTLKKSYKINRPTQLFLSINKNPLASATIAQIHRATCRDGSEVVVKTQYADQERLCKLDLSNLKRLAAYLEKHDMKFMDMKSIVNEFDAQIPLEFDFIREAEAMTVIRENMERAGICDVVIPHVIPGLVSRSTIAMTFVDGVRPDNAVALRRFGVRPENVARAVGRAIGQMMLVDGFMHADVHLGNVLVLRDGRVCLLDFGQCKRLPEELRLKLCSFYLSLCVGNKMYIAKTFYDIGVQLDIPLDQIDDKFFDLVPTYANGMFDTAPLPPGIDISPFSENSPLRTMPIKQLRPDLFMVLRTMGLLRALCETLEVNVTMSSIFRPYALAGLRIARSSHEVVREESRLAQARDSLTSGIGSPFAADGSSSRRHTWSWFC